MNEMAKLVRWDEIAPERLNPLLQRRYLNGRLMTIERFTLHKGCQIGEHFHGNEQFSYALEGALKLRFPHGDVVTSCGEAVKIPPNLPHSAEAPETTQVLDVFVPVCADWSAQQDDCLRGLR
jgi:quercetin dioxygenase-like cupin family protein